MNIDKEVNMQLFMQQQEQSRHLDYEKEFGIYKATLHSILVKSILV